MNRGFLLLGALVTFASGCKLQTSDWGLGAIAHLQTPLDSPDVPCGTVIPADTLATTRAACTFGPGARSTDTLGAGPEVFATLPIRHILIVMRENRSFDHLLGKLHEQGQPGTEAIPPAFANPGVNDTPVSPRPAHTTCIPYDPGHQSRSMIASINGGRMDGFVKNAALTTGTDGAFAMDVYGANDLPFYYWVASTFALADRHFAPMASGTFPNRSFLLFGTNAGILDTGITHPAPSTPSILQSLMNAGLTWAVYSDGAPFSSTLGWDNGFPGVHPLNALFDALDRGTLPNVAFVDGVEGYDDDHPVADLQVGEAWFHRVYDHTVSSPQWPRLALIWTYDEAGGFADHVPPDPPGCAAEMGSRFTDRGPRIPLGVISPWARRGFVSHVPRDHTAITRFVEATFDLPALTRRDANADALLDLFDFSCGQNLSIPAAPAPGQGGCPGGAPIVPKPETLIGGSE